MLGRKAIRATRYKTTIGSFPALRRVVVALLVPVIVRMPWATSGLPGSRSIKDEVVTA